MTNRTYSFNLLGGIFVSFLAIFLVLCVFFAQGPDLDLHFVRDVPTDLSPSRLDRNISAITRWPQWFFNLEKVTMDHPTPSTQLTKSHPVSHLITALDHQMIQKGSKVIFHIDPHKGLHNQFDLTAEVTEYIPGQTVGMKILKDSSGRLNRLFDSLSWKIEILPESHGSLIRGIATAHTSHWRSRLFGRIAGRVLMNQVFYPDLVKLAELKQPFSVEAPALNSPSI